MSNFAFAQIPMPKRLYEDIKVNGGEIFLRIKKDKIDSVAPSLAPGKVVEISVSDEQEDIPLSQRQYKVVDAEWLDPRDKKVLDEMSVSNRSVYDDLRDPVYEFLIYRVDLKPLPRTDSTIKAMM